MEIDDLDEVAGNEVQLTMLLRSVTHYGSGKKNYGSHQVKNYSWQAELLSVIGCYGHKNSQFKYPRGLAFSNNKVLYVVEGENFRIQVFQQDTCLPYSPMPTYVVIAGYHVCYSVQCLWSI